MEDPDPYSVAYSSVHCLRFTIHLISDLRSFIRRCRVAGWPFAFIINRQSSIDNHNALNLISYFTWTILTISTIPIYPARPVGPEDRTGMKFLPREIRRLFLWGT